MRKCSHNFLNKDKLKHHFTMDLKVQLNDEQKNVLEKFRQVFQNEPWLLQRNDCFLLRWLLARNFDLIKAEKMLRDSIAWREENQIDEIMNNFCYTEVMKKYKAIGIVSHFKSGDPLVLARVGLIDTRGLNESIEPMHTIYFYLKIIESFWSLKNEDGNFTQITAIVDLKEVGIRTITGSRSFERLLMTFKIYQANYPEALRKIFIINVPKIFDFGFSFIKPLLDEKTLNKVCVFEQDPKVWKPALLAEIPAEILPVSYGGTLSDPVDGNPNCSSLVNMGGEIPTSYYLKNQPIQIVDSDVRSVLVVKNRSKKFVEIQVKTANTILDWEFKCEEGDLGFSIKRKAGEDVVVIVPHSRVSCHLAKEQGQVLCDEQELYMMEFDNSFSYLRSKTVSYSITMTEFS